MEPISGLTALYEMLRRKIGDQADSTGRAPRNVREENAYATQRIALAELEQQIREKLREQAPGALTSAGSKRWVIASLLAWELDDRMKNEPKFNALVRTVQESIDGDARLKMKLEQIMAQLSK